VVVDGRLKSAFGPATRQDIWEGVVYEQAYRRKHVFDIWMPHLVRADIISIDMDDDCILEAAPPLKLKWLVYGDSVTQGMTCTQPAISNIARCALALDAEAHNLAIGGATADSRLAETVPDIDWDIVSIAYGSNDWNQSLPVAGYVDNSRRLIEVLLRKRPGKPVVLITPVTYAGNPPPNKSGLSLDDYRKALTEMAVNRPGVFLMQGTKLVPDDEKWFVDKCHTNDAGMELYAKSLLPVLKEALSYKPR
jgi:lysophospholipase L1-like esterase